MIATATAHRLAYGLHEKYYPRRRGWIELSPRPSGVIPSGRRQIGGPDVNLPFRKAGTTRLTDRDPEDER